MRGSSRLSVAMIVRDEAQLLPVALASVAAVADELVIVDTGSSDGTRDIARAHGARVLEIAWPDDFSAARNAALDAATGDWILSLDADETLAPGQEAHLRTCLGRADTGAWLVRIKSPLSGTQMGQEFVHRYPRLFRNLAGVRFRGRVHEQLNPALAAAGCTIRTSNLVLVHSGYCIDTGPKRAKLERNLRLLDLDLAERPGDAFVLYHRGETWSLLQEPARAVPCYEAALQAGGLDVAHRAAAHQNLASVLLKLGRLEEAAAAAGEALRIEPQAAMALLLRAATRTRQGAFEAALRDARDYLRRCASGSTAGTMLGFAPDAARAWLIVAECHLRTGDAAGAARAAAEVRASRPDWGPGERLYARLAAQRGEGTEALLHWRRAVALEPEHTGAWGELVQALAAAGDVNGALDAVDEALAYGSCVELFRLQARLRTQSGRFEAAIDSYESVLRLDAECVEAHRRLAGLYRKCGDDERARVHLGRLTAAGAL